MTAPSPSTSATTLAPIVKQVITHWMTAELSKDRQSLSMNLIPSLMTHCRRDAATVLGKVTDREFLFNTELSIDARLMGHSSGGEKSLAEIDITIADFAFSRTNRNGLFRAFCVPLMRVLLEAGKNDILSDLMARDFLRPSRVPKWLGGGYVQTTVYDHMMRTSADLLTKEEIAKFQKLRLTDLGRL